MGNYKVRIKKSAGKELEKIHPNDQHRLVERIQKLSDDPRPIGSKKLSGDEKYRIRQGNFRILYEIFDEVVTVVVIRIAHRREVYRG